MEYEEISENQWRTIQYNGGKIAQIKERAFRVVKNLAATFNEKEPGGVDGVMVAAVAENEFLGTLSSPFGECRFSLRLAHHKEAIVGHLVVERKSRDNRDRVVWEPVWSVLVPHDGRVLSTTGANALSTNLFSHFGDDASNGTFEFGMKVLYSLIKTR